MNYQHINRLHATVLWLILAVALYLSALQLRDDHLACWYEPPTGQSACTWDNVEFARWQTAR
jgi:hypothetical protein